MKARGASGRRVGKSRAQTRLRFVRAQICHPTPLGLGSGANTHSPETGVRCGISQGRGVLNERILSLFGKKNVTALAYSEIRDVTGVEQSPPALVNFGGKKDLSVGVRWVAPRRASSGIAAVRPTES